MDFVINKNNGNLTFSIETADDRETIELLIENQHLDEHGKLAHMLDSFGYIGNAKLMPISPTDVGALTDAPMLTDLVVRDDNGEVLHVGNVWWFEPYQVSDFLAKLLEHGTVTFFAAPENEVVTCANA